MGRDEQEQLERDIRSSLDAGDHAGAATLALRGYGGELFGFLYAMHRDEHDAAEVFSRFTERLWRDLPRFHGDSSFRTWAYALARHASFNYRRDVQRRAQRQQALPEDADALVVAAQVRTATVSYLRTERRSRFAALRESLPPEDQELLILRVDRGLEWSELARVLHAGDEPLADDELRRAAARLRKRFQLLKGRLRELGRRAGVIDDDA